MPESVMHATTEPAEIAALLPSKPRSDSAMLALYSAALGSVYLSRYLPIFTRFDEAGRTTTSWNWAASLCTLNWMVFRRLWGAALVYVAAAEGLVLLVFGVGRPLLQWPQAVEWGVAAAFFLLSCAVPGLYGNALLHADIHKKIARALTASHTLNEACALLGRQASSWKRLAWLAAGNLALMLAAVGAYLAMPATGARDSAGVVRPAAAVGPMQLPPSAPPTQAAIPPAQPAASEPAATYSSAAIVPAAQPQGAASAPTMILAPEQPDQAQAPSVSAVSVPLSATQMTQASGSASPSNRPGAPRGKVHPPGAKALPPDLDVSAASTVALPPVGTAAGHYINVGLFAEEANARMTQARLLNDGLPAFRQEIFVGKKRRLRVRVGPFRDRAEADAAASAIRAMALEAVVIRQGP